MASANHDAERAVIETHRTSVFCRFEADPDEIRSCLADYEEDDNFKTLLQHVEMLYKHEDSHMVGLWKYPGEEVKALALDNEGSLYLFDHLVDALAYMNPYYPDRPDDEETQEWDAFLKEQGWSVHGPLVKSFGGTHPEVYLDQIMAKS